jgi:hypothetical protein
MHKRRGPILASLLLLILAVGCGRGNESSAVQQNGPLNISVGGTKTVEGSGKTATEDRKVEGFHHVHAHNAIEVVVEVTAGTESATVEADDNLLRLIQTKVEHGTLDIGVTGSLSTRNPLRVRVAAKQLDALTADSSAKISSKDVPGDDLALTASSSGNVTLDNVGAKTLKISSSSSGGVTVDQVDAKLLKVSVSSSGNVTAAGRADRQEIDGSSSGGYDGGNLVSRTSSVTCSSAAHAVLHATEEVSGSASSSGSVRYAGSPGKVAVATSSAGSVEAIGK